MLTFVQGALDSDQKDLDLQQFQKLTEAHKDTAIGEEEDAVHIGDLHIDLPPQAQVAAPDRETTRRLRGLDDQVQVAELVPEVALLLRFPIRRVNRSSDRNACSIRDASPEASSSPVNRP